MTPADAQTMSAYNAEMNRRFYAAAGRLSDTERRADRGAFWHSIHGTLSHLVWADRIWMSRLGDWPKPAVALAQSDRLYDDFAAMTEARVAADEALIAWSADLDPSWFDGSLTWYSGAANREVSMLRSPILLHLFNHQTHHRGQVHAMLTAAGEKTGDTDLWLVVP